MVVERCEPARHLYVAVPAYSGEVKAETALALAAAGMALALAGIEATFALHQGCCYLDHTRNVLATSFLRSPATDMLFVDADVVFDASAVVQIARSTRPFVAGIYPIKDDKSQRWPVSFGVDELWSEADGAIEAVTVPTGFLRLNRAVFDAMPMTPYADDGQGQWMGYFHSGVRIDRYRGEDTGFCLDWRALGGKVYILPELAFKHVGPKAWTGSWGEWMRGRMAPQQETIAA